MNQRYGELLDKDYPDHSEFLWHLTGRPRPLVGFGNVERDKALAVNGTLSESRARLISILTQEEGPTIWGSYLHYMTPDYQVQPAPKCVCFTECIPFSLLTHSRRYSKWGLLFKKETAYRYGARPVWYVDPTLMNQFAHCKYPPQREYREPLPFPTEYLHLLMPFAPEYGNYKFGRNKDKSLDWMAEREWRASGDFEFRLKGIAAIIVPSMVDMTELINDLPDVSQLKFLVTQDLEGIKIAHQDFGAFLRN